MAPIKINIKSSSADLAEQSGPMPQPSVEFDKVRTDSSETGNTEDFSIDTAESGNKTELGSVETVETKKDGAADSGTLADNKNDSSCAAKVTDQTSVSEAKSVEVAAAEKKDLGDRPEGGVQIGPGQDSATLYEYEGDDVYYTNQTTKGTVPVIIYDRVYKNKLLLRKTNWRQNIFGQRGVFFIRQSRSRQQGG